MMDAERWLCDECDTVSAAENVLRATNPFDPEQDVAGCPKCKSVNQLRRACGYPGCGDAGSNGTRYQGGYVTRCWLHSPQNAASPIHRLDATRPEA